MDDEAGFNLQRVSPLSAGEMTLRDYFAGQALNGLLSAITGDPESWADHQRDVARAAYGYADAMLRARKEG